MKLTTGLTRDLQTSQEQGDEDHEHEHGDDGDIPSYTASLDVLMGECQILILSTNT